MKSLKYIYQAFTFLFCIFLSLSAGAQDFPMPIIKGLPKDSLKSAQIQKMVLIAHSNARCTINEICDAYVALMEGVPEDSLDIVWSSHPNFALWLGKSDGDPNYHRVVKQRIDTLREWLESHTITYNLRLGAFSYCELTHSTAYTSQLSRNKVINLCPYWLRCRPKQKASTIIHELVHKMGFGHPKGTTYPSKAIILARTHPKKAVKSPENYEGLAESFFCKASSRAKLLGKEK